MSDNKRLILSREAQETVLIQVPGYPEPFRVTNLGGRAKLAIEAPAEVLVLREELNGRPPKKAA